MWDTWQVGGTELAWSIDEELMDISFAEDGGDNMSEVILTKFLMYS